MARAATRLLAATRRLFGTAGAEVTDRTLLARFANDRDERAFAELVDRHGPMVHAAGRRLLNDSAAADDVFQATFLVLARKAGGDWQASVGPWLHAVAVRLARKARSRRPEPSVDPIAVRELSLLADDPAAPLAWAEVKGCWTRNSPARRRACGSRSSCATWKGACRRGGGAASHLAGHAGAPPGTRPQAAARPAVAAESPSPPRAGARP